jgi:hypothetical protein
MNLDTSGVSKKRKRVFELPSSGSLRADIELAVRILDNISAYDVNLDCAEHSIIELLMSTVVGVNKFPIWHKMKFKFRFRPAITYFPIIPPNEVIRSFCYKHAPVGYEHYVSGAYLSAQPTLKAIVELAKKMSKDNFTWDIDMKLLRTTLLRLLVDLDELPKMNGSFPHEFACDSDINPHTSTGFPLFAFNVGMKKRDTQPYVNGLMRKVIKKVMKGAKMHTVVPPFVHKFFFKTEVRTPDEPIDKVRALGTMGPFADAVAKVVSIPTMARWQCYAPVMIGVSIWSTFVYQILKNTKNFNYNKIHTAIRGPDVAAANPADMIYIILDLSAQDMSFNPLMLFVTLYLRLYSVGYIGRSESDVRLWIQFFTVEMGYVNVKVVEWLDGMFYIFLGIMCSGYVMTSHGDTMSLILVIRCVLCKMMLDRGIRKPWSYWESFLLNVYGDDTIIAARKMWIFLFGEEKYPELLADTFRRYGLTLKPGETEVLIPKPDHVDRLFTHIVDDKIVSQGVHFLQRHLVKYDRDLNPLHPDADDYFIILPWRKTGPLISKSCLDAKDWTSCGPNVFASFYLKCFGLIMDAGPNRTAHTYFRTLMDNTLKEYPYVHIVAHNYAKSGALSEYMAKLGMIDVSILLDFHTLTISESLEHICSHMEIDSSAELYKKPAYFASDYREFKMPEHRSKYYVTLTKNGLVTSKNLRN